MDTHIEGSFMVGYVKFNALMNPYPFCHTKHVLEGLPGKFGSWKCFTGSEILE